MPNSDDNPSISNGVGADPTQRLASFKPPRDLSLGAAKLNKKVFLPNLNVVRNKNKGLSANNSRDKRDDRSKRDRRNDRNKNNRNGPSIIKSSGIFSEGLGSAERHSSRVAYSNRDSDPSPVMQRPTIRIKDVIKIDKELEEQQIRSVFGDNHQDQDDAEELKRIEVDAPVKLPMDNGGSIKTKVPKKVIVKSEPVDNLECSITTPSIPDVKTEVFENTDIVNLLKSDRPSLILLQLPDTLPGRGASAEDDSRRAGHNQNNHNQPSTSNEEPKQDTPVEPRCRLSDLEEGRIGKLRVHRSGRVTLALGDTIFEVHPGTKAAFYQEVVSMAVSEESRSANLVALGQLQHKLNLVPDWEAMFTDLTM